MESSTLVENTVAMSSTAAADPSSLSSTSSESLKGFQDTSTDCAICLCPLVDDGNNDEAEELITLSCGHRWHLRCVKEQLEHAQPSPSKRLLFTGCQCAKCGLFCDHPKLQHLTRKTDSLRNMSISWSWSNFKLMHQMCGKSINRFWGEQMRRRSRKAWKP